MSFRATTDAEILRNALGEGRWERANRELLAKTITELWFEDVLYPEVLEPGGTEGAGGTGDPTYRLTLGDRSVTFTARARILGHHRVDPASLETDDGRPLPDVPDLLAEVGPSLGMDPSTLANAVIEITNTLVADCHQLADGRPVRELLDADPIDLEANLRAHPWIVANKGRLGFDVADLHAYAPESRAEFRLQWLAVRADRADLRLSSGLDQRSLLEAQLGIDGFDALELRLADEGLSLDEVVIIPVHPWQWKERIAPLYAADIARGDIVALGNLGVVGPTYRAQQSIRTLVDVDHPWRRYLKVALGILNTSVYRGIPRQRALVAPELSAWFCGLVDQDPFLQETGLVLLGEVASVSVAHPAFEVIPDVPYQHTELLGAIWRDSVDQHLEVGERAITLAALLHRDPDGVSFVAALVERSGLDPQAWVDALHEATLPPLAHVLYRYGAAFSPHAQNCLIVLRNDIPVRLVVKDFVDDAMISCEDLPELADLPPAVRDALGGGLEGQLLVQWLQGGLLVCVHRYLSEIFEDDLDLPETAFWASAACTLHRYQDRFADDLEDRYALFEIDAPVFVKLCLNRVRMFERGYDDDAERPLASASGVIENPLFHEVPADA